MIYLFLGYGAVWTMLFLYLLYLSAQQRQLARDLQWLKEHLSRHP